MLSRRASRAGGELKARRKLHSFPLNLCALFLSLSLFLAMTAAAVLVESVEKPDAILILNVRARYELDDFYFTLV